MAFELLPVAESLGLRLDGFPCVTQVKVGVFSSDGGARISTLRHTNGPGTRGQTSSKDGKGLAHTPC